MYVIQWRGSPTLHTRLEGRLVAAHVLCSAQKPAQLAASCAAFRVAGISHNVLLDVRSIPFHAGETVTSEPATQSQGLSVLESLAIGVCVLMLVFVYAAGIIFYIHYKQKQRRKKDPEMNLSNTISTDNASTIDSRIGMDSMRMKSNPLLNLDNLRNDYSNDAGLSDVSERTEDTFDSSSIHKQKLQERNLNVVSAIVHSRRKKPSRPTIRATSTPERITERLQRRSASPELEKAPHSDLSILHCSMDNNTTEDLPPPEEGETVLRKKLYFNPVFFETDLLKDPPPAAIEFLKKLREVMSIAKEKMTSKRFIPVLSDIPEEELYHTIDLGWDIPCARRGRRYSAISLKRENSRRALHCGGCPGCNGKSQKAAGLIRSNSCKTCVSDDYKQKIVQKWLDEVPTPPSTTKRPIKSIAKVSGTPRVIEPKENEEVRINLIEPVPDANSDSVKVTEIIAKENLKDKYVVLNEFEDINEINKNNIENDNKRNSQAIVVITSEKKSPSNHASRRVRKNLPPPPPPPLAVNVIEPLDNKEIVPISPEVKRKMEAVIRELNKCRRVESISNSNNNTDTLQIAAPKLVIPVVAADHNCYNSGNFFLENNKDEDQENVEFDSLERKLPKKRRFSLDYRPEANQRKITSLENKEICRDRLTRSWRDLKNASNNTDESSQTIIFESNNNERSYSNNNIFINSIEPIYNNIENLGPLTIEVRGSPIEDRKKDNDDFDPDTLDRKPKKPIEKNENKKCVEKILLKSGGSFKHKLTVPESEKRNSPPEAAFTRKIGSLRQIYEAKNKVKINNNSYYERRGSLPYGTQELEAYIKNLDSKNMDSQKEPKPPIPPKNKRSSETQSKSNTPRNSPPSDRCRSSEERDRFPPYSRSDNNSRRSGRRSARTRPRRVDIKKLCRTEDSGYLSTDSNESKRRARYLMQLKPKLNNIETCSKLINKSNSLHIDTDTDDLESLCDGRSESGGESVETDSVFFGNFDDSKQMFKELGFEEFESKNKLNNQGQIDSGFVGETNILLSGDSDSEHRSVISIVTGRDGRASSASLTNLEDQTFVQSVECS
ncbi:unnamed protein product [Euphydryas editha]|uniref:Uncharacterized protein n=1 Tax=Euphydryas editha TaxID=104508 RepID=A0AAU9TVA0_EUPED|nr:unnamed protein product [Euphydryas editha]